MFFETDHDLPKEKLIRTNSVLRLLTYTDGEWELRGADDPFAKEMFESEGRIGLSKAYYDDNRRIRIVEGFLKPYEENREYVDARIKAGIEQNRKSWGKVQVLDRNGQPVSGAHLRYAQKSHDFKLGANIFMLDEMESEEKNAEYKRLFADTFNMATVPFYWNSLEPEQGKPRFAADSPKIYRRPAPDLCLDFCREHGITPKAHCLNYDGWSVPAWVPRDSVEGVKKALERRFEQLAERYRDRIEGWEVTNETLCACTDNHTPFFYEDDFVSWSFETARRYFPRNELIIN